MVNDPKPDSIVSQQLHHNGVVHPKYARTSDRLPWDIDFYGTKKNLLAVMTAVLKCHAEISGHFTLGDYPLSQTSIFMRLMIPKGLEQYFVELTGIYLKQPPKIKVS